MLDNPQFQPNNVKLILSFDDLNPHNVELAQVLKDLGFNATFFLETKGGTTEIRALHELGFEIGGHTFSHPGDLKAMSVEEARGEIEVGNAVFDLRAHCVESNVFDLGAFASLRVKRRRRAI